MVLLFGGQATGNVRSNEDKRKAVQAALNDPKGAELIG